MTTAVIVQARMGSTRFPGKVLADLAGKPVLAHVLERCNRIPGIGVVVCAIPFTDYAALRAVISASGARTFSDFLGPPDDVMGRYLAAAQCVGADIIVRITADCPMLDPEICGAVLRQFRDTGSSYASNVHPRTFPQGLDCEVFKLSALEFAERVSRETREHVTTALVEARSLSRVNYYADTQDSLAHHRWTLDYPEDLEFMRAVFAVREPRRMADVLDVLRCHPEIAEINACRKVA